MHSRTLHLGGLASMCLLWNVGTVTLAQESANKEAGEPAQSLASESLMDQHVESLVAGRPTCTALRLGPDGLPEVIMHLYFDSSAVESQPALREIVESFRFGSEHASIAPKIQQPEGSMSLPDWRTLFLPAETPADGQPLATYYDPTLDLAITFRPARMNLGCRMSWPVYFNGYDHTGQSRYWYLSADAVTAAAQARRDRNTNPQLYLYRWTGSSYALVDSSTFGREMDFVGSYSSSCSSSTYKVRAYMSNEGYYNTLIVAFTAG